MNKTKKQSGFTVIELMIALSVLSILLVMSSVILIQIGAIFTKGVRKADLQNANRNVVADIGEAIQFGGDKPLTCTLSNTASRTTSSFCYNKTNGTSYSYCVDKTRYTFVMNKMLGVDDALAIPETKHVLWRDTLADPNDDCNALDLQQDTPSDSGTVPGSGSEMMPNHTRLTRFLIYPNSTSGVYDINVWMAAGPSDLVVSNMTDDNNVSAFPTCKSVGGNQFCAASNIDTQVTRRKAN